MPRRHRAGTVINMEKVGGRFAPGIRTPATVSLSPEEDPELAEAAEVYTDLATGQRHPSFYPQAPGELIGHELYQSRVELREPCYGDLEVTGENTGRGVVLDPALNQQWAGLLENFRGMRDKGTPDGLEKADIDQQVAAEMLEKSLRSYERLSQVPTLQKAMKERYQRGAALGSATQVGMEVDETFRPCGRDYRAIKRFYELRDEFQSPEMARNVLLREQESSRSQDRVSITHRQQIAHGKVLRFEAAKGGDMDEEAPINLLDRTESYSVFAEGNSVEDALEVIWNMGLGASGLDSRTRQGLVYQAFCDAKGISETAPPVREGTLSPNRVEGLRKTFTAYPYKVRQALSDCANQRSSGALDSLRQVFPGITPSQARVLSEHTRRLSDQHLGLLAESWLVRAGTSPKVWAAQIRRRTTLMARESKQVDDGAFYSRALDKSWEKSRETTRVYDALPLVEARRQPSF